MFKTIMDVVAVWTVTILANISAEFIDEFLPHIRDSVTILSCILAMWYTMYKLIKEWKKRNGNAG